MGLLTEPVDVGKHTFYRMEEKGAYWSGQTLPWPLWTRSYLRIWRKVPLLISGRESVQQELSSWFGKHWEKLQMAATFNLVLNAA